MNSIHGLKNINVHTYRYKIQVFTMNSTHGLKNIYIVIGFECLQPLRYAPQLTVTKIFTYIIYLYVFITVKIVPQLNRLSRTA